MDNDAGSATLEAVIIAPMIILLATLAVVLGRIAIFKAAVHQAAQAAARAGSISRTEVVAKTNAEATWDSLMGLDPTSTSPTNNVHCVSTVPAMTATAFEESPGSPQAIVDDNDPASATNGNAMFVFQVQCTLEAKWLLGVFGEDFTITETAYSPVDPYRCRADQC